MRLNIDDEVASLQEMTTGELRERYAEVFGEEPRSRHKAYLIRKIAWRLQANAEGDLSERARTKQKSAEPKIRCAIYTRKSTEDGLDQEFNSLDAQREAGEAFIASQKNEGWVCLPNQYDDGGFSGGNAERPALKRLLADIEDGQIDCVVVYKVDRLSRSLLDFARIMGTFEPHNVSFVSVTQQFNTTHSMGRLTLNILLSFAQFEREIIGERIRDKIAAVMLGLAEIELQYHQQRQMAGVEVAKKNGIYQGRKRGTTKAKPARAHVLRDQGLKISEIANALGKSTRTVQRNLNGSQCPRLHR